MQSYLIRLGAMKSGAWAKCSEYALVVEPDAIIRELVTIEVAAIMKVKSLQICERQVTHNDRFIKRAVFNAFATNLKEQQRLEI